MAECFHGAGERCAYVCTHVQAGGSLYFCKEVPFCDLWTPEVVPDWQPRAAGEMTDAVVLGAAFVYLRMVTHHSLLASSRGLHFGVTAE